MQVLERTELKPFSFPRNFRLLKRADFLTVQSSGLRFSTDHIIFLYGYTESDHMRFGFTVSRKNGNSVKRNRIKRRMREAVRLKADGFYRFNVDVVCIPRRGLQEVVFCELLDNISCFIEHLDSHSGE